MFLFTIYFRNQSSILTSGTKPKRTPSKPPRKSRPDNTSSSAQTSEPRRQQGSLKCV